MTLLLVHAFVGWALCAAVMGIGLAVLPFGTALVVHAAAAPLIFAAVSFSYFRRVHSARPLVIAATFVAVVAGTDFFIVALVINRSLDMFKSVLGTWLPFGLIFLSTYLSGRLMVGTPPFRPGRGGSRR